MTRDVQLIEGDLPPQTQHIEGATLVAQRVRIRLGTFRGEWLLDQSAGLPFLRWRSQRSPPLDSIAAKVREELRATPGVLDVRELRARHVQERVRIEGELIIEGNQTLNLNAEFVAAGNTSPTVALTLGKSGALL